MKLIDKLTKGYGMTVSRKAVLGEDDQSVQDQPYPEDDTKIILDNTKGEPIWRVDHLSCNFID